MAITPQTRLRLLKVPIEIDNKNQLTFENEQKQREYFLSLPYIEIEEISYQRKDSVIYFPAHIDSLLEYNYVMYLNENYTNKYFYAFITNMEYITDFNTAISITTDVFQTWQFNLTFKESFIEREMINVNEDIPGANLLPEGLETGEYKVSGTAEIDDLEPWYIVAYAEDTFGFKYNGIYSGIQFYAFSDSEALRGFLVQINLAGKTDYILNIFTVPKLAFYPLSNVSGAIDSDIKANPRPLTLISTPDNLDGYIPRNQKLRTYPYLYIGFNPNGGSGKVYRYENFENGQPKFEIISEINPNPQICVIPQNYRGANGDSLGDIGLINGYPTISWSNDVFNSWLAQNSDIIKLQMSQEQFNTGFSQLQNIGGVANSLNSALNQDITGAISGAATSGLNYYKTNVNHDFYVKQQMAQIEKQSILPNTGTFGGNNTTLLGYDKFDKNIFTRYTIKKQFAERIDKYFDMYGYLTNTVKVPNLNNRPNWNYIKTIGCNIIAHIPQSDLQTIKNMFDNGITLWHNKDTFLDYSKNNR